MSDINNKINKLRSIVNRSKAQMNDLPIQGPVDDQSKTCPDGSMPDPETGLCPPEDTNGSCCKQVGQVNVCIGDIGAMTPQECSDAGGSFNQGQSCADAGCVGGIQLLEALRSWMEAREGSGVEVIPQDLTEEAPPFSDDMGNPPTPPMPL